MARKLSSSSNNTSRKRKNNGKSYKKKCSWAQPSHRENSLLSKSIDTDKCLSTLYFSYLHFLTVVSLKKGLENILHNFVCLKIWKVISEKLGWLWLWLAEMLACSLRNVKASIATCFIVTAFLSLSHKCISGVNCVWCFGSFCLTTSLPGLLLKLLNRLTILWKSAGIICLDFGLVCWKAVKSFISKTSSKKIRKCIFCENTHNS